LSNVRNFGVDPSQPKLISRVQKPRVANYSVFENLKTTFENGNFWSDDSLRFKKLKKEGTVEKLDKPLFQTSDSSNRFSHISQ
jgi:hypothetical protein